jgi:hypothetical protein
MNSFMGSFFHPVQPLALSCYYRRAATLFYHPFLPPPLLCVHFASLGSCVKLQRQFPTAPAFDDANPVARSYDCFVPQLSKI